MKTLQNSPIVIAVKDAEAERPIPSLWRPVSSEVVDAFVRHDYRISSGVPGVAAVSIETANDIERCIKDYGATLVALPEETWKTSVCIWMGNHWDVLVDLWTVEEGSSDLVLRAQVSESAKTFAFKVDMVYVP